MNQTSPITSCGHIPEQTEAEGVKSPLPVRVFRGTLRFILIVGAVVFTASSLFCWLPNFLAALLVLATYSPSGSLGFALSLSYGLAYELAATGSIHPAMLAGFSLGLYAVHKRHDRAIREVESLDEAIRGRREMSRAFAAQKLQELGEPGDKWLWITAMMSGVRNDLRLVSCASRRLRANPFITDSTARREGRLLRRLRGSLDEQIEELERELG